MVFFLFRSGFFLLFKQKTDTVLRRTASQYTCTRSRTTARAVARTEPVPLRNLRQWEAAALEVNALLAPCSAALFFAFFCSFAGFRRMEINTFWFFLARQTLSNGLGWLTLR